MDRLGLKEEGGPSTRFSPRRLIIAAWTGRDREAVQAHIRELEAIGVSAPARVPCFYSLGRSLLTTSNHIQVLGPDTSGEAEVVLLSRKQGLWVGVGSDHTDRKAETLSISTSKQLCPKPVGREIWPFSEVLPHWDQLILRSHLSRFGRRELYQEGPVSSLLHPETLIEHLGFRPEGSVGTVLFCGTIPALGAVEGGDQFEIELQDPVLGRSLRHRYEIEVLENL